MSQRKVSKYNMDEELDVEWCDAGQWRSYHIQSSGETLGELYEGIIVAEVDQDGGEIDAYALVHASNEVIEATYATMERYVMDLIRKA